MRGALVTGAGSFIGRHLVKGLLLRGVAVTGLERRPEEQKSEDGVRTLYADVTDRKSLGAENLGADAVFHLAAYVHKEPKSRAEEDHVFKVNVLGTRNLLESLPPGVRHVIFLSTVGVHGADSGRKLDEAAPVNPLTAYARSKLYAEIILENWGKLRGIKTTSLRLPMVYGPGNKGNIRRLIEAIDRGRFIMPGRGDNLRSMSFVGNVVDAAIAVYGREEADGKAYIVTDGKDYTLRELYSEISAHLGRKGLNVHIPMPIMRGIARIGDLIGWPVPIDSPTLRKLTSTLTFSSEKIQKEIGFRPRFDLYRTIGETVEAYKAAHRNL